VFGYDRGREYERCRKNKFTNEQIQNCCYVFFVPIKDEEIKNFHPTWGKTIAYEDSITRFKDERQRRIKIKLNNRFVELQARHKNTKRGNKIFYEGKRMAHSGRNGTFPLERKRITKKFDEGRKKPKTSKKEGI